MIEEEKEVKEKYKVYFDKRKGGGGASRWKVIG